MCRYGCDVSLWMRCNACNAMNVMCDAMQCDAIDLIRWMTPRIISMPLLTWVCCDAMDVMWYARCVAMDVICRYGRNATRSNACDAMDVMCDAMDVMQCDAMRCDAINVLRWMRCDAMWYDRCDVMDVIQYYFMNPYAIDVMRCDRCDTML